MEFDFVMLRHRLSILAYSSFRERGRAMQAADVLRILEIVIANCSRF